MAELAGLFVMLLSLLTGVASGLYAALLTGTGTLLGLFLSVDTLRLYSENESRRMRQRLLGLGLAAGRTPEGRATFEGERDGLVVRYSSRLEEYEGVTTRMHCWGAAVDTGTLRLISRRWARRRSSSLTGDRRFDRRFLVSGSPADLARLTAPIRAQLLHVRARVRLEEGMLWLEAPVFAPSLLGQAEAVGRALAQDVADPTDRLWRLVTADPSPAVRRRALQEAASQEHPGSSPDTLALCEALLADPDAAVRTEAAILLGDARGLLQGATDRSLALELRRRAARGLLSAEDTLRLEAGEALAAEPSLRASAVALLRSTGPAGEGALLHLLPRVDGEMLGHVVAALASVGTVASVPGLRARRSALKLLQSGLRAAIDHAVSTIQSAAGGERGTLALVVSGGAVGALALAEPEGGLSLYGLQDLGRDRL